MMNEETAPELKSKKGLDDMAAPKLLPRSLTFPKVLHKKTHNPKSLPHPPTHRIKLITHSHNTVKKTRSTHSNSNITTSHIP